MSALSDGSPQLFDLPDGPTTEFELKHSADLVCGVDEVGRGPLAGPVVAAAVILDLGNFPDGLNDSKKLSEAKRLKLFEEIMPNAHVSISCIDSRVIDRINIREASLLAMTNAVKGLEILPQHALIDGNAIPSHLPCPATTLVKGDSRSVSIAAASIVAKVVRDNLMIRADQLYPGYGLASHKGYGTKTHMEALKRLGPCVLHRRSFSPVRAALQVRS